MNTLMMLVGLLLSAGPAFASSFTWGAWNIPCSGTDQVVTLPNNGRFTGDWVFTGVIGAGGPMPALYTIGMVEIYHDVTSPNTQATYALVGKADLDGTGGDYISPAVFGRARDRLTFLPGYEPVFRGRDELHIHTTCPLGAGVHSIWVTVYYR